MSSSRAQECPLVDFDPFSDAMLSEPFDSYEELRKLAPVVKLARYDCWAVLDYEALDTVLTDWESYSSAAGVGLDNYRKARSWRPQSIILEADPPDHNKTRRVLNRVLSRPAMEKMRQTFSGEARKLITQVLSKGEFDGITDLAEVYPLKVFPDAVGLQQAGRENLLAYGALAFNASCPHNQLFQEAMANAEAVIAWITSQCTRAALTPDGLGAQVFDAVDRGELEEQEAGMLVRSLLSAGVDTTINGIGNALYCFARFPAQWQLLRERPELIRGAIDEVLRFEGAVMNFFRTTTREVNLAGYRIPENEKVLVLFSAGSRDPKKWPDAHVFDITRETKGHLGFGAGVHTCVGQMVARLEVELILNELVQRVDTLALNGRPVRRLNNALRGLASLPLKLQ
ncbi:MAG: cytochrome P450 [Pseudomonadales bacterium]|nr:cytochrome P450 [Pseudomonadales bacterium]